MNSILLSFKVTIIQMCQINEIECTCNSHLVCLCFSQMIIDYMNKKFYESDPVAMWDTINGVGLRSVLPKTLNSKL